MRDDHEVYYLTRFHLSLSSFASIVPFASHWWCRVRWRNAAGESREADAEHVVGEYDERRFDTREEARAAGLSLAKKIAGEEDTKYFVVTEGEYACCDPQECLHAPGNLRSRLNKLWRIFERLDGWEAPKEVWPAVQAICDRWDQLMSMVKK